MYKLPLIFIILVHFILSPSKSVANDNFNPESNKNNKNSFELLQSAKNISVKIQNSNFEHCGTGVIIAKRDKVYSIITSKHIFIEESKYGQPCVSNDFFIITNTGEKFSLSAKNIFVKEGIDIASFKFYSSKNYQTATIYIPETHTYAWNSINYYFSDVTPFELLFVGGFPFVNNETKTNFILTAGHSVSNESSSFSAIDDSKFMLNKKTDRGLINGYELTYSNQTYYGMSGGAILNLNGNLMGIHGSSESFLAQDAEIGSFGNEQIGYSIGIPIKTIIDSLSHFKINYSDLKITHEINEYPINKDDILKLIEQEDVVIGTNSSHSSSASQWLRKGFRCLRLSSLLFDNFDPLKEGIAYFDKVILNNPKFVHLAYYGKAKIKLINGKDANNARLLLDKAISVKPDFHEAYALMSSSFTVSNRYEEALESINNAIKLQPNIHAYYNSKASILGKLNRYPEALQELNQAIEINPLPYYLLKRADLFFYLNRLSESEKDFRQAIEIEPHFYEIYSKLANLLYFQGRESDALSQINKMVEIAPDNPEVYVHRGVFFQGIGDHGRLIQDMTQVINLSERLRWSLPYMLRGEAYYDTMQYQKAISDLTKVIDMNSSFPRAYYLRGLAYSGLNYFEPIYSSEQQINSERRIIDMKTISDFANALNFYCSTDQGKTNKHEISTSLSIINSINYIYFKYNLQQNNSYSPPSSVEEICDSKYLTKIKQFININ